ncbi:hypothetical protein ABMA27_008312 [Loxostege sticticalis]|uniref:Gustatory receptor n=1 Tax=Loxostege sticticalis TaxID=481309 RepID=A0ABR3HAT7_LOXSC
MSTQYQFYSRNNLTRSSQKNMYLKKLKPFLLKGNVIGQAECSMSGALALAFRMSQIVGIAPVRFDGGRVRMSRALIVLSCMVGTVWPRITYFYTGYYYAYTTLFFTVMQFIICALEIYRTMRSLNVLLEEVAQAASLKKTKIPNPFVGINVVQMKALNKITDSLSVNDSVYPGITKSSKTAHETIRHLSLMYSSACEAVRQLNDCFAPELLALLMSFLLHLVVTPYNCIANISGGKINMQLLTMQLLWCSIHFVSLIVMVEPCHITQREMGRTNFLVSQLMLQNTDELVTNELNVFGRYLYLNDVVYSPMGICVLSRSLVASILASVTTYLVIMMQFQATENIVYHG